MILSKEQIISFNRFASGFVIGNKYLSKALNRFDKLIVLTEHNQLIFDFNELNENYQLKFISNNFQLYCTSLFIAFKPIITTFLKNEGFISHDFDCVFLMGPKREDRLETVSVRNEIKY